MINILDVEWVETEDHSFDSNHLNYGMDQHITKDQSPHEHMQPSSMSMENGSISDKYMYILKSYNLHVILNE